MEKENFDEVMNLITRVPKYPRGVTKYPCTIYLSIYISIFYKTIFFFIISNIYHNADQFLVTFVRANRKKK